MNIKTLFQSIAVSTVVVSGSALAAVPAEVTAAAEKITTDGAAVVGAIGAGLLTMAALALIFKWAKASIFG